jgi:hypothetical protein
MNCEQRGSEDCGVRFGEELRASPPRQVQEIPIQKVNTNVVRPLFHSEGSSVMSPARSVHVESVPFQPQGAQANQGRVGTQTGHNHGSGMLAKGKLTKIADLAVGV